MLESQQAAQPLARRLLACEAPEITDPAQAITGAEHVLDSLRKQLARLLGNDGAHALLARALDRARSEHPSLEKAKLESPGAVRLHAVGHASDSSLEQLVSGMTLLIASLLALLVRLIGREMVARIVQEVWPDEGFEELFTQARDDGVVRGNGRTNAERLTERD